MTDSDLAFGEFVELIAAGTTPEKIIGFRPSDRAKERVADLIRREKNGGLSEEEEQELERFLQVEHFVRLAKARARQYVGQ